MSYLEDWFAAELAKAYHEKVVALGYWCPRCQLFAPPLEADRGEPYELGVTPGWCCMCGLDPLVEGPMFDAPFIGLANLIG